MQATIRKVRPNVFTKRILTPTKYSFFLLSPCSTVQRQGRLITMASQSSEESAKYRTQILPVNPAEVQGLMKPGHTKNKSILKDWDINIPDIFDQDFMNLAVCADALKETDIPVAFPTETVYGLGADARRGAAVRGIYKAKQRPADNPLIVHFASLRQLLLVLCPTFPKDKKLDEDIIWSIIPRIYKPLIHKFWPGPLTIILPNPANSPLAPEVTAGLSTFGARMPRNLLALLLIRLANIPVAAPSANASTKPSPTAAEHVLEDLDGRIEYILDGGPCDVGVESTVVDGLSNPPVILRPGGVSIEQLRECEGWENVRVGYKDRAIANGEAPRAPGMKYRHYSPRAKVVLHEMGRQKPSWVELEISGVERVGVIRTKGWPRAMGIVVEGGGNGNSDEKDDRDDDAHAKAREQEGPFNMRSLVEILVPLAQHYTFKQGKRRIEIWDVGLGPKTEDIARGLFSALRELDRKNVEVIFVEGINEEEGDVAAAVMNRLRKAAEVKIG